MAGIEECYRHHMVLQKPFRARELADLLDHIGPAAT
jgi:hypothetical protein